MKRWTPVAFILALAISALVVWFQANIATFISKAGW